MRRWKAWALDDAIYWDAVLVLKDLCPNTNQSSKHWRARAVLEKDFVAWKVWTQNTLNIADGTLVKESLKSVTHRNAEVTE